MNVQLTDHLTCPRCGPEFGLILLAQDVVSRRVREGELGCPNCRDRFPVSDGFADLRAPPRASLPLDAGPEPPGPDVAPVAIAAGLGVSEGPGYFVFIGDVARSAADVAALVRDMEVVAVDPSARSWSPRPGVSPMAAWPGLPFRGGARGVALAASSWADWGEEAVRVAAPRARIVVTGAGALERPSPAASGLETVLEDGGLRVLGRP